MRYKKAYDKIKGDGIHSFTDPRKGDPSNMYSQFYAEFKELRKEYHESAAGKSPKDIAADLSG